MFKFINYFIILCVACFSKIFSDKNTNTKPYQTHHSNNKIFQHFNPNVVTKLYIIVGDDHRCWWLNGINLLIFIPVRKKENIKEPVKVFILLNTFSNISVFQRAFPRITSIGYQIITFIMSLFKNVILPNPIK